MSSPFKKDILFSLICGEISSWFLILVIKNIKEFERLSQTKNIIYLLPLALPLIFLAGIAGAKLFERFFQPLFEFAKFVEIGILNTFIDMGILNFLSGLTGITSGAYLIPISAASFLISATNSYFWNKSWTFTKGAKMVSKEFFPFLIVSAIGLGINSGIVFLGTTFMSPLGNLSAVAWMNIVKISAVLIVMLWNFIGYKLVVFKK